MKLLRTVALCSNLLLAVSPALAEAPVLPIKVTVANAANKVAFKGTVGREGGFSTANLTPGNYVVRFNAAAALPKGQYTAVLSSGKKKVSAAAIDGEKFNGGGVAMRIEVASGLNIAGQIAKQDKTAPIGHNGKPMVWIPQRTGSNVGAHWAESDSAEAKEVQTQDYYSSKTIQDMQSKSKAPASN
jgi:hypothetical protein